MIQTFLGIPVFVWTLGSLILIPAILIKWLFGPDKAQKDKTNDMPEYRKYAYNPPVISYEGLDMDEYEKKSGKKRYETARDRGHSEYDYRETCVGGCSGGAFSTRLYRDKSEGKFWDGKTQAQRNKDDINARWSKDLQPDPDPVIRVYKNMPLLHAPKLGLPEGDKSEKINVSRRENVKVKR